MFHTNEGEGHASQERREGGWIDGNHPGPAVKKVQRRPPSQTVIAILD
jgi:hypothetical protein